MNIFFYRFIKIFFFSIHYIFPGTLINKSLRFSLINVYIYFFFIFSIVMTNLTYNSFENIFFLLRIYIMKYKYIIIWSIISYFLFYRRIRSFCIHTRSVQDINCRKSVAMSNVWNYRIECNQVIAVVDREYLLSGVSKGKSVLY